MAFAGGRPGITPNTRGGGLADQHETAQELLIDSEVDRLQHEKAHKRHERWLRKIASLFRR